MIPYLVIAMVVFTTAFMCFVVVPTAGKRRAAAAEIAPKERPEPLAEPRVPRDTSRPYPRPKGGRRKQDSTCPVCGTGDSTGMLDGRVLGWRAHPSCAEWLGDWKPPRSAPSKRPAQTGSTNTVFFAGKGAISAAGGGAGGSTTNGITLASPETMAITEQVKNGLITPDEARERLDREIVAAWGVPPALLTERTHKAGDPIPIERCPKCGAQFAGTPDYLREAYKIHLKVGCGLR